MKADVHLGTLDGSLPIGQSPQPDSFNGTDSLNGPDSLNGLDSLEQAVEVMVRMGLRSGAIR